MRYAVAMDAAFWLDKWKQGQIGFHAQRVNRFLSQHVGLLGVRPGRSVYAPLCGKSNDLHALRAAGFGVIGSELSPAATESFFVEAGLQRSSTQTTTHLEHNAGGYCILEGDIFNIPANAIGPCDAAWDRAALVAMSPERRDAYVAHVRAALKPDARLLLVTFEYDTSRMSGPPFSVDETEVRRLWEQHGTVRPLGSVELIDEEPRFRERGVDSIREAAYLITLSS